MRESFPAPVLSSKATSVPLASNTRKTESDNVPEPSPAPAARTSIR